jgi:hypothetical protein
MKNQRPGPTDRALAAMHLESLYVFDDRGDLVSTNEQRASEPPLAHLVTTREGNRWRFHARLPAPVRATLDELFAAEPPLDEHAGPPLCAAAARAALEGFGYRVDSVYSGPGFALPRDLRSPDGVIEVRRENEGLLDRYFDGPWSDFQASRPMFAVEADGHAVSHCFCARRPTTPAVEAGVRTAEAYQRRGYAPRVVAAWAEAIYARGRLPLYSTWWNNEASRAVAERLGGRWYGVDFHLSSAVMLP